jgi:hypothetical protein
MKLVFALLLLLSKKRKQKRHLQPLPTAQFNAFFPIKDFNDARTSYPMKSFFVLRKLLVFFSMNLT